MALLPLELEDIELAVDADPLAPPVDWTEAEVNAVKDYRLKIRSTIKFFARQLAGGVTFAIAGRPNYPSPDFPQPGSAEPQEAAGWAQQVLARTLSFTDPLMLGAFRLSLYNDVDNALTSKALVVLLGTTNNATNRDQLRAALIPLFPLMAKGQAPGRYQCRCTRESGASERVAEV